MSTSLPSIRAPLSLPFYYASLVNCVVHYLVEARRVEPFLANMPLKPALFGGRVSVAFNFQA